MLAMSPMLASTAVKSAFQEATVRMGVCRNDRVRGTRYQEAQRRKMGSTPARLDHAWPSSGNSRFRSKVPGVSESGAGMAPAKTCANKIQRSFLIDQLLDLEVSRKSSISDQEFGATTTEHGEISRRRARRHRKNHFRRPSR